MHPENIETLIHSVRGHRVILDSDLAKLYGVPTKRLNEQVKRNRKRFPHDFAFKLTQEEINRSQFATGSQKHHDPRFLPYVFTEHGALMAANVLNSPRAVAMSVYVIRIFVKIRETVIWNDVIEKRFAVIEKVLLDHDETLRKLLTQIKPFLLPSPERHKKKIVFHSHHANAFAVH